MQHKLGCHQDVPLVAEMLFWEELQLDEFGSSQSGWPPLLSDPTLPGCLLFSLTRSHDLMALGLGFCQAWADQHLSWWLSKMLMLWRNMLEAPVRNLCGTELIFYLCELGEVLGRSSK